MSGLAEFVQLGNVAPGDGRVRLHELGELARARAQVGGEALGQRAHR